MLDCENVRSELRKYNSLFVRDATDLMSFK